MQIDSSRTLLSSVYRFFSGTLISRFTGFGREVLMAAFFGATPEVAAFWMAFRFSHLLRRLFGEGGLTLAFVPHFESLRKNDPLKAARFFHHLSTQLSMVLWGVVIAVECVLGVIWMSTEISPENEQVLRLTMLMLPSILFICLSALNQSLLQCQNIFFTSSASPSILNLVWIGALLWLHGQSSFLAMERLAMVMVFAFAAQWVFTLPLAYGSLSKGLEKHWWRGKELIRGETRRLLKPFALSLIGVAATQINSALDALFARAAALEGPAYLWYAIRLQQVPLGLLGVGLMGALLPSISRAYESKDQTLFRQLIHFATLRAIGWMIPATMGFFAGGLLLVNFTFGRGAFSQSAAVETTLCLWNYAVSLLPMTLVFVFASAFYAQKNYKIPTLLSLLSVLLNGLLNAIFVYGFEWGTWSIAAATSLATLFNAMGLFYVLQKQGHICLTDFIKPSLRVSFCAGTAMLLTITIGFLLKTDPTLSFIQGKAFFLSRIFSTQILQASIQGGCFLGILFLFAKFFKIQEILDGFQKKREVS